MDKKQLKESLRDMLPRGFNKMILQELKAKGKELPSHSKVSRVCNPDTSAWDDDIMVEALSLAKVERSKLNKLNELTV